VYGKPWARQAAGLSPYFTHARWTHPGLVGYLSPGVAFSREMLSKSTGVGIALAVAWDVYEYGWGSKRDVGLASTEFAAAVTVDVAATVLFPAVGAAAGAAICGPGAPICVAAGIAAGYLANLGFSRNVFRLRERSIEAVSAFYESYIQALRNPESEWYSWPNIPGP